MTISVDAVYEGGVLRPLQPLPLADHSRVHVTIKPAADWIDATAGILGWTGSGEELDYFALDPDLDPQESA
jgi:predicted DNA-binding antitoxin AbrB/MazE fold protein